MSAFAPGANIDVYEAPNTTFGALDEYAKIVNDNVDKIVTSSWGLCEQAVQQGSPGIQQAENIIFQQAAAQGQTVFSAAGDAGSNDCNAFLTTSPVSPVLSVDDPSSQPYVVAAGGTTIDNATQPASEHVWNDGAAWGAAGGGISEAWPMPTWQLDSKVPGVNDPSVVSAANAFEAADLGDPGYAFCASDNPAGPVEDGCRELPDVSAAADEFTGGITVFIDQFGGWNTFGGTSSAAPLWAAMLAEVNSSATCKSNPATQNGVGFLNPLLYSVASNPTAYAASFNDIKVGNNDAYGDSNLFHATTGYDMASGLGTPQLTQPGGGAGLAFYLCSQAPAVTRPTVTQLSPSTGFTSDPSTSVTITGSHFQDGTNPVVGVQVGDYQVPAADFSVSDASHITVTFPAAADVIPPNDQTDGAGRVQVSVTLQDGETSAVNVNSWFTYVDDNGSSQPLPTVTSVHTYAGPETGGNSVTVYGAGFTGATSVTFGGVPGTIVSNTDTQIKVTVPAFQNGVTTCDQDGSNFDPSQNATNDICQTQVEVTTPNGTSTDSTILPLYEGAFTIADDGVIPAPAGQEAAPASTEYDYVPTPTITSISTSHGAGSLASEEGGSVVTILGKGFNLATLDWVNFGSPTQASSQQFFNLVSVTGTKIEILAPGFENTTVGPATLPVTIQSVAGLSNSVNATYAGIPTVSAVHATAGPTAGTNAAPDTGGTPIEIDGSGFANQTLGVIFNDVATPFSLGTQYNFTASSDTKLTTATVAQNPAVVDTLVCTVTDCSAPTSPDNDAADVLFLFPPGDPKIDSITPASGPATGGTAGDDQGPEPRLRDEHLVRQHGRGRRHERRGASRLWFDGHGHGDCASGRHRHGAGHASHGRERRDRRAACDSLVHVHQAAVADPEGPQEGERLREDHKLAERHPLPEDLLAQVRIPDLGHAEGEARPGLELRRLVGRVSRQVQVQAQGHRTPHRYGQVHAQELRRAEREGQDPPRRKARPQDALLLGGQDQAGLLEQGASRPRDLAEPEGRHPSQAQRPGEPDRQQGVRTQTRRACAGRPSFSPVIGSCSRSRSGDTSGRRARFARCSSGRPSERHAPRLGCQVGSGSRGAGGRECRKRSRAQRKLPQWRIPGSSSRVGSRTRALQPVRPTPP